ncbi:Mating-type protein MAT-1 [Talaromyces islandicus]|uniref:Mating-type protein MAT-1 n=1 Tax=Talaromyces islandicus TaxID=28573 RepID=A0A0U1LIT8_TALIS|nr:Mating-type protein MAT-1 [Talaromyces islandicus]
MTDSDPAVQDLNPLQRAFNLFIMNLPVGDLHELVDYVSQPGDDTQPFSQNLFLQQTSEVLKAVSCNANGRGIPSSPTDSSRSGRSKKNADKKLRPLNSFIAYRSFYSTIFTDMTQKSRSGIIKYLWQIDPYKAKWAILAKAYSILRDDHGNDVSLDTFLELTVPLIGLILPCNYLEAMGCQIITSENQQYHVQRTSSACPDLSNSATNYSVIDIVNYCYERGYVEEIHHFGEHEITTQVPFAARPNLAIQTDQGPINLDNVDRAVHNDDVARQVNGVEFDPIKSFLSVRQPVRTQYELFKMLDGAVVDLSEVNAGDPDFYAPFNPAVQTFPTFDPLSHDPFDGYDISEMNF